MVALYPLRYSSSNTEDVPNLAALCEELKVVLQSNVLSYWRPVPVLAALVEEKLLYCTGDPHLRLRACWDRRLRGTFLDFEWTKAKPEMPQKWSFFTHCRP